MSVLRLLSRKKNERSPIEWIEWQAHVGSQCLQMPKPLLKKRITEELASMQNLNRHAGYKFHAVGKKLAKEFGVYNYQMRNRMIHIGFQAARGALNFVEDDYITPFAFDLSECHGSQTFVMYYIEGTHPAIISMETFQAAQLEFAQRYGVEIVNGIAQKASYFYHQNGETGPHPKHRAPQWSEERRRQHAEYFRTREGGQCRYDFSHFIECEHCHGHLQASLKHYVDGTTEVGWVDVEHTMRAKDTPRPVVFRDSALRKQIASVLGWETFDAGRMFETLSGISVNVDMVTLHFKDGDAKQFRYIQPRQVHRKRKETT